MVCRQYQRNELSIFQQTTEMAVAAIHQPNVSDYLSKKQRDSPQDLATEWAEIEELHNKRFVNIS